MGLIEVSHVAFGYHRDRRILNDVSLQIRRGVNVGIVGESGSGKTTLLRLLLGLIRPSQGEIRFNGARLDPANRAFMRDYRKAVQVVFQDPYSSLDPRQRVRDIIAEPLRSLGIPGPVEPRVLEVLNAVGLAEESLDRYPHAFSGGQRQRIAIARAIVSRPAVLLADEAVSALDLATKVRIVELLKTLSHSLTLVLVSHDLSVVAALCEEMVIVERGRIVESGRVEDILAAPRHGYTQKLLAGIPRMPR
ncbi:ATP-binding cassette domain-containing protein [Brenneria tiliae]|uniref:ATP-binding cassette domain-containing protein n=1 Tax=Brenneria tiliae TaxID=2914984 RepID=A0ABT0MWH8_9GAMM|nr:ATP-binding cassette domain-containing protein [Brenneria tiliae]MCL2893957.1 ATP-binding cassette domain-containing protein [Brenneria tiliae]